MLQRIQTLYLLVVVILGTLLCFYSPVQFLLPDGLEYISLNIIDKWPFAVMTISVPTLTFITIWLYKNRLLQTRINIMTVILSLGYYALLALYIAYIIKGYETLDQITLKDADWYLTIWSGIPLVNIILLMMATRRILKDEALVRAADRLR
jgi:hypothetical protein